MRPKNWLEKRLKIAPHMVTQLAKIDELRGRWQGGIRLSPHILGRLKKSVIITSTGASTRIEGSVMSDKEIERFLRGLKSHPPKNRDEEEVAGYADLTGRVFDNYQTLKLTEGQILQFHKILLQFSKKDLRHRGQYKSSDNIVVARTSDGRERVLFRPTPPYLVKKEMDDALIRTRDALKKGEHHPILVICDFIFEFLAIHPFIDGNGRLSRALTNLLLLQAGYPHIPYVSMEEIIEERLADYYQALRTTQAKHKTAHEDITPWVDFMLKVLLTQSEKARALMESEQPEKLLSASQAAIYALFTPGTELAVADIRKALKGKTPDVSIKQVLTRLVFLRLLELIGQGRATRYKQTP